MRRIVLASLRLSLALPLGFPSGLPSSLALGAVALCGAGPVAWAQGGQPQLDAMLARLRDALGPGTTLTYGKSSMLPDGHATLSEVRITRGPDLVQIGTVELTGVRPDGADEVLARELRFGTQDRTGDATLARLTLRGVTLPQQHAGATPPPVPFTLEAGSFEQLLVANPAHTDVAVASGSLSGLQLGQPVRAELRDLEFRPHDDASITTVRVGRLGASVSDATSLLDGLRDRRAPNLRDTQALDAERIVVDGPEGALASADSLHATFDQSRTDGGQLSVTLAGLHPGATARIAGTLHALGYDTVTAHLSMNAGEVGSGRGSADPQGAGPGAPAGIPARLGLQFGADNVANTEFELSVDGVPRKPGGDALAAAFGIRLVGSRLSYRDSSLLGRLFAMQARQRGGSADTVREGYARMVAQALGNGPGVTPAVASVRDAIVAFLRNPGTLTVTARPERPVPVLEIPGIGLTPDAIIARLGISATAQPSGDGAASPPVAPTPLPVQDGKPRMADPPAPARPEIPGAGAKPSGAETGDSSGRSGTGGKPAPLPPTAPATGPGGKPPPG